MLLGKQCWLMIFCMNLSPCLSFTLYWFVNWEISHGYWCGIYRNYKERTVFFFVCSIVLFEWNRIPFGFSDVFATIQRFMEISLWISIGTLSWYFWMTCASIWWMEPWSSDSYLIWRLWQVMNGSLKVDRNVKHICEYLRNRIVRIDTEVGRLYVN